MRKLTEEAVNSVAYEQFVHEKEKLLEFMVIGSYGFLINGLSLVSIERDYQGR